MGTTARERKRRVQEKSRVAVNHRRASRVQSYVEPARRSKRKPPRKVAVELAPEYPQDRKPYPLSLAAQFMELRPKCVSPIEWFRLFDHDVSIWPFLVEVVEDQGGV